MLKFYSHLENNVTFCSVLKYFFITVLVIGFNYSSYGQTTFTSQINGNWKSAATWGKSSSRKLTEGVHYPGPNSNVIIAANTYVTIDSKVHRANNLTIERGATLNHHQNNNYIVVSGNYAVDGTHSGGHHNFSHLYLTGANATFTGTGTVSVGSSIYIEGNKTIPATANLNIATSVSIAGSSIVTNNGIITVTNNNSISGETNSSTWTNNRNSSLIIDGELLTVGILNASAVGNRVTYSGSLDQTLKIPSGNQYFHLSIINNGKKTAPANNIQVGGNFSANSSMVATGSTFTFNGASTTSQTIEVLRDTVEFDNVVLNPSSANVIALTDITVNGTLSFNRGKLLLQNSSTLNLGVDATMANYSADKYIVTNSNAFISKKLAGEGDTTFSEIQGNILFPVGDENNYTPFTFRIYSATLSNASIQLGVRNTKSGANLTTENYLNRTWVLEPTGITNAIYDATMIYMEADVVGDETTFRPWKFSSGSWTTATYESDFSRNVDTNTLIWRNITSFSEFTGVQNPDMLIPAPVKLISFSATPSAKSVELNWATATERNNDFFSIERSADGKVFEVIATVKGKGTTNTTSNYRATDNSPVRGTSYYRLKQTDFDGSFEYSKVVVVRFNPSADLAISVYPNPSNGEIVTVNLNGLEGQKVIISVLDVRGNLILEEVITPESITINQTLGLKDKLATGLYLVNVRNENVNSTTKLLVK